MPTLLLVTDDLPAWTELKSTLQREGYRLETADCVASALEFAREEAVEMFVVSGKLKDLTPFDLLELRDLNKQTAPVKVLVFGADGKSLELLEGGCDEVVSSKCSPKEVVLRISRLLKSSCPP